MIFSFIFGFLPPNTIAMAGNMMIIILVFEGGITQTEISGKTANNCVPFV